MKLIADLRKMEFLPEIHVINRVKRRTFKKSASFLSSIYIKYILIREAKTSCLFAWKSCSQRNMNFGMIKVYTKEKRRNQKNIYDFLISLISWDPLCVYFLLCILQKYILMQSSETYQITELPISCIAILNLFCCTFMLFSISTSRDLREKCFYPKFHDFRSIIKTITQKGYLFKEYWLQWTENMFYLVHTCVISTNRPSCLKSYTKVLNAPSHNCLNQHINNYL